ncbi:MAG: NAD(P)H-dependent oxidoreductase [Microbacteriaceae bacterium]
MPLSVVAVSGSLHSPSKTRRLLDRITAAIGERREVDTETVEVSELEGLGAALGRGPLPDVVAEAVRRVESAELLVVASPVYRASYTGLFKHLFDLVGQQALAGTPVLLAATGGDDRHSLVIEHQLRPLFGFFGAATLPLGVYARDADFAEDAGEELDRRIAAALAHLPG